MIVNNNSFLFRLTLSAILVGIAALVISFAIYFIVGPWSFGGFPSIIFDSPEKPLRELAILLLAYFCLRYGTHWHSFDVTAWFRVFLMGAAFLGVFFISYYGIPMPGDAGGYYAWLRSIIFDHDIHFANEYHLFYPNIEWEARNTPLGLPINKYSIGVSIYEIPGLVAGSFFALVGGFPQDGWSAPYRLGQAVWQIGAGLTGLWLLFHFISYEFNNKYVAAILASMVLVGTNTINYFYRNIGYAHVPGLVLQASFLYISNLAKRKREYRYDLTLGLLIGWIAIIRPTNVLLFPFLALFAWDKERTLKGYVLFIVGAIFALCAQLVASNALWGTFFPAVYPGEGFTSGYVGIISSLISDRHGLFIFHPWYAILLVINMYGAINVHAARCTCIAALSTFAAFAVANGTWYIWWFGASFGNRSFIETLIPLSVGAGYALSQTKAPETGAWLKKISFIAVLAVSFNLYLWYGFLKTRYDHCGRHTLGEVFLWPVQKPVKAHCVDKPEDIKPGIAWPRL